MSEIDTKYAALGGASGFLGAPEGPEKSTPDKVGRFRHYKHGSIYWHPLTGAHEVHGLIRAKWAKLGWEKSFLGYPKTDETDSSGGAKGRFNLFQGGAITWKSGADEAFETHGAIRSKFGQMGFEAGFLGYPTTDETKTPDKVGRFNHFEGGSIYWKPTISAHEVHGLIRGLWQSQGWEKGELGYPISDELPAFKGSKHRFNDFENGVAYWKHGSKKAVPLSKFVLFDASRTAAEMVASISEAILPEIKKDDRIYIKSGPKLTGVTDYAWNGARVRNRLYKIHVGGGIDVSALPDPTFTIDFLIGVDFNREKKQIWTYLDSAKFHAHVPFPTSIGLDASEITGKIKKALDPLVGKPQGMTTISENKAHILSVKVMKNGDLNTYLVPLADA
ncbi:hypothetical protein KUH32_09680 [Thalassococcus sp. CAU 1522]|uniref:LGFP repeat-containing protein n=1 Tax=Thalassococcus arenae TaxID=2851652 RepID=A0ABS6N7R2_9RHOB|nr:hypothetical protein [Thalassococcus arenae]MBV2360044.1 hypothetical protein [Thalassococcus arenae]